MSRTLNRLARVLEKRRSADPDSSYTASLYAQGTDAILKKIAEESAEVIMATKDGDRSAIVREITDLWFHTIVLLVHNEMEPNMIIEELDRRADVSGLTEKAERAERADRGQRDQQRHIQKSNRAA